MFFVPFFLSILLQVDRFVRRQKISIPFYIYRLVGRIKIYILSVDIFCCIGLLKFSCVLLLCRYFLLVIYSYFLAFDSTEVTLDI